MDDLVKTRFNVNDPACEADWQGIVSGPVDIIPKPTAHTFSPGMGSLINRTCDCDDPPKTPGVVLLSPACIGFQSGTKSVFRLENKLTDNRILREQNSSSALFSVHD